DRLADGLGGRVGGGGGPEAGGDAAGPAELDSEKAFQGAGGLAMGGGGLVVEFDDGGLGIGSELGSGGAEGVGRLQGVASLNPAAALMALTDVDVELAVNGLARDLDLELLGDVRLVARATAIGASVGPGRPVGLVDLARGGPV